jgi:hypothetical protein
MCVCVYKAFSCTVKLRLSPYMYTIVVSLFKTIFMYGEVYSIQQYVIKFVSYLRQVGGFHRVFRFPPPIKLAQRYNSNIVGNGVKNHKSINQPIFIYNNIQPIVIYKNKTDSMCAEQLLHVVLLIYITT